MRRRPYVGERHGSPSIRFTSGPERSRDAAEGDPPPPVKRRPAGFVIPTVGEGGE